MTADDLINIKIKCLEISAKDSSLSIAEIRVTAESIYNWVITST
jgi:hypothetical protein